MSVSIRDTVLFFFPLLLSTRLSVNKTALQKAVRRGEEVSYTITDSDGQSATNAGIRKCEYWISCKISKNDEAPFGILRSPTDSRSHYMPKFQNPIKRQ